jgi:hypothetical protein
MSLMVAMSQVEKVLRKQERSWNKVCKKNVHPHKHFWILRVWIEFSNCPSEPNLKKNI